MKFLLFGFDMPPLLKDAREIVGGAAVQWKSWIKGFRDNGYEFGLLTWEGAEKYINRKLDFDIVECYNPKYGIKKLRLIYYQFPKLYKAIKRYEPNYLIQTSATTHTFLVMIMSKLLAVPCVHRIASDAEVDERIVELFDKKNYIFLYRLGIKYTDFLIAQNSYQYNKLREKYPAKNTLVLHNPYEVETKESDILPRKERNYVAWVGNFRKIKNLSALVTVARELPEINFKIAGIEHENLEQETRDALFELKKLKNVEFAGYLTRSEIKVFLSKSIALLNTSINEGFSNTFLEAWGLGVPVVTTKNVNPDGIVNKNNLGKVADSYDQLYKLLKMIIDYDEIEYNNLALHCHKYVKENHDPKILAEKFASYLISNT